MLQKTLVMLLAVFLVSAPVPAKAAGNAEIFDITREKVVGTFEVDASARKAAEDCLKGINGLYVKIRPIPQKGFMMKIPLRPAASIQNKWLDDQVNQVILLFPDQGKPYLMVFEHEKQPLFFFFEANTEGLRKKLEGLSVPEPGQAAGNLYLSLFQEACVSHQ